MPTHYGIELSLNQDKIKITYKIGNILYYLYL